MLPCQHYHQTFLVQAGMDKSMLDSISGSVPPKDSIEVFKGGEDDADTGHQGLRAEEVTDMEEPP